MPRPLPFVPGSLVSGPWPTFQLDAGTRQSIVSGQSPRVSPGHAPAPPGGSGQNPPISNTSAPQGQPVRVYDPATGTIVYHQPAAVPVGPSGEPGGIVPRQKPKRVIGPQ